MATRGRAGSSDLKGPGLGRVRGARGSPRGGLSPEVIWGLPGPEIVLGKRSSCGYLALPPAPAPRGLGRGRGEARIWGAGFGGGGAATPRCRRREKGKRGQAVKGTEAETLGAPIPPPPSPPLDKRPHSTQPPAGPPRPTPDLRSPGPRRPPQQPPLLEGVGQRRGDVRSREGGGGRDGDWGPSTSLCWARDLLGLSCTCVQ